MLLIADEMGSNGTLAVKGGQFCQIRHKFYPTMASSYYLLVPYTRSKNFSSSSRFSQLASTIFRLWWRRLGVLFGDAIHEGQIAVRESH